MWCVTAAAAAAAAAAQQQQQCSPGVEFPTVPRAATGTAATCRPLGHYGPTTLANLCRQVVCNKCWQTALSLWCRYGSYGPTGGLLRGARVIELHMGQDTAHSPTWIRQADGSKQEQPPAPPEVRRVVTLCCP